MAVLSIICKLLNSLINSTMNIIQTYRMADSTFTKTSSLQKTIQPDGYRIIETISTKWSDTPESTRYFLLIYCITTVSCYATYNYNDGKRALLKYRKAKQNGEVINSPDGEWSSIKQGINHTDNLLSALFFPWTITEKIMPSVILYFNPAKTSPNRD